MSDPATRTWITTVLEGAALVVLLAVCLDGFPAFIDLHVADEVGYQIAGRELMHGGASGWTLAYAPVFSLVYGALDALAAAPERALQDWMLPLASFGSSAALWWALRGLTTPALAFVATAWWIVSAPVSCSQLLPRCNVYLFSAGLTFVACGLAGRGRRRAALAVLAIAAFNRVELAAWLLVVAAVGARRASVSRALAGAAATAALAAIVLHALLPAARDRSWLVFSQHFAVGVAEREPDAVHEFAGAPMTYHAAITARSFGDADSLASALLAAPGAFVEHVLGNLRALPEALAGAVASPCAQRPWLWVTLLVAVAALALAGAVRGARSRPGPVEPLARTLLRTSAICALASLLVRPRCDLLLPCYPLIALAVGHAAARGVQIVFGARAEVVARARVIGLSIATLFVPTSFPADRAGSTPFREAVAVLGAHDADPGSTLFAAFGRNLLFLAGRDGPALEFQSSHGDTATMRARAGDRLLVTAHDVSFHAAGLRPWIAAVENGGWHLIASGLDVWLFERDR